jgi:hypothetical protein
MPRTYVSITFSSFVLSLSLSRLSSLVSHLLVVLGLELRVYTLSHSTSPIFVMGVFEIGSRELFAWAGFECQSS